MRRTWMKRFYIYKPIYIEDDGSIQTKWQYVDKEYYLNKQEDINELDIRIVGNVDYNIIKLRTNKFYDIEKGYGIAKKKLEIDSNGFSLTKPDYIVYASPKIGKLTTFICKTII